MKYMFVLFVSVLLSPWVLADELRQSEHALDHWSIIIKELGTD